MALRKRSGNKNSKIKIPKNKKNKSSSPKVKRKGFVKRKYETHKKTVIFVLILIIAILFSSGTKLFLYVNFLLGNDIVIRIESDKEDLTMRNGETRTLNFTTKVTANPFCKAECSALFEDLSRDDVIDRSELTVIPGIPIESNYEINIDAKNEGQKLYRLSMSCHGVRNLMCNTKEESTTRNILITVKHELNAEEKAVKEEIEDTTNSLLKQKEILDTKLLDLESSITDIDYTFDIEKTIKDISRLKNTRRLLTEDLLIIKKIWGDGDYILMKSLLENIPEAINDYNSSLTSFEEKFLESYSTHNKITENLVSSFNLLRVIKNNEYIDEKIILKLNDKIQNYNDLNMIFKNNLSHDYKLTISQNLLNETKNFSNEFNDLYSEEILKKHIENDVNFELICNLTKTCNPYPEITTREIQNLEMDIACDETTLLNDLKNNLSQNNTLHADLDNLAKGLKRDIANTFILKLDKNGPNSDLVFKILSSYNNTFNLSYNETLKENLTNNILNSETKLCVDKSNQILEISQASFKKIFINHTNITFYPKLEEKLPVCCIKNNCNFCNSKPDNETYPVILIHGHSFNKGTEADYSLDAFSKIQLKLEEDGIINSGSISIYTPKDTPEGVWGVSDIQISLTISYYQDLFKHPENYVIVQTKSENIDTYAIRLREIIETIKFKTGSEKVNIIAHSMGGLVTRRYMQLFDEDEVNKLIMIGTPNHGIDEDIATKCRLLGEDLECRDMLRGSLFLNKLDREDPPNIPITLIYGTGCAMKFGDGDGIVLTENAIFESAKNIEVKGSCTVFEVLHTQMLDTDLYPEVYDIIVSELKN